MAEAVLDSSLVLAYLQKEPGSDAAFAAMPSGLMSVVNLAEVVNKLVDGGMSSDGAINTVGLLPFAVADADVALAHRAGALRAETKHLGLSLGDRFCLALAEREGLPALTGDRKWGQLDFGVSVRLFR